MGQQHTPGPHVYEPLDPGKYPNDRECAGAILDAEGREIATVWKLAFAHRPHPDADEDGTVPVPEAEANGRLFAAAEGLLAANRHLRARVAALEELLREATEDRAFPPSFWQRLVNATGQRLWVTEYGLVSEDMGASEEGDGEPDYAPEPLAECYYHAAGAVAGRGEPS